jgi:hypothetical protein
MLFHDAYADGVTPREFMDDNLPDREALGEVLHN